MPETRSYTDTWDRTQRCFSCGNTCSLLGADGCGCVEDTCLDCGGGVPRCAWCSARCENCECEDRRCPECGNGTDPECEDCSCECYDCGCGYRCDSCGCREDGDGMIRSYSANAAELGFKGDPKDGVYFGIELETQSAVSRRGEHARKVMAALGDDFVLLKEDGSIGYGFEIVTAPATLDIHRRRWEPFFLNKPAGLTSWKSGDCGMHVHVSRPSPWHVGKIITFVTDPAHLKHVEAIAGRSQSGYARFHQKTMKCAMAQHDPMRQRYEAVNQTNASTLEFRIFRGTLKPEAFFKNLEFCHAVYYFTRDVSPTAMTWEAFVTFVRSARAEYPHLLAFIDGGMKRAKGVLEPFDSTGDSDGAAFKRMKVYEDRIARRRVAISA